MAYSNPGTPLVSEPKIKFKNKDGFWKTKFQIEKEVTVYITELETRIEAMRNHENCAHRPYDYKKEVCRDCGSDHYLDNWQQKDGE